MNITHPNKGILLTLFLLLLTTFFSACSTDDDMILTSPPSNERGHLVSYTKTGFVTAAEVAAAALTEGDVSAYTKYDLDIYAIVYNSLDGGILLEVSGLIFMPKAVSGDLALIQNHHGTIISGDDGEVPSTYTGGPNGSSEMYFVGATMASYGYVVSMPDYVGYGASSDREHPYTVHRELAEVSVDMLRATKQLMKTLSIGFSNEVHLTGWSEGGGAALATHQYLQRKYADEFTIIGSSLLAGPYDYFTFVKDVITNRNIADEELSIYSWALYATKNYNATLNEVKNDNIWSYSVVNQLDALSVPSLKPAGIFQVDFMDGIANETNAEWVAALKDNTLLEGWVPEGHLYFHSGTQDLIVPHYNSVNAHNYFKSLNVQSTLYEYTGGDHYTPLYDYVTTTLDDFNSL